MTDYVPRLIDQEIADLFRELPALLIVGPRGSGKTTTAARHARTVVHLDRPAEAAVFQADADFALAAQPAPVLLDEWQVVPDVLGAVKRAVDRDGGPGRFILTGSVRASLTTPNWPGTGRVTPMRMFGLTQREIGGTLDGPTFLDQLAIDSIDAFSVPPTPPNLGDYIDLAMTGGFPDATLALSDSARRRWLSGYLDQTLSRDIESLSPRRDSVAIRRYFEALALNSAGLVQQATLQDAAGISRTTADVYDALLSDLFVVDSLPAWSTNRVSRLSKARKRYIVDPALIPVALRLDRSAILRDGDTIGRLLDTFVLSQLRPELELSPAQPRLYHLRHHDQSREIDIVAEMAGTSLVGIEVKATASPSRDDARHLVWLRDQLGPDFVAGAVLHTGPAPPFVLSERIFALPIASLWS